MKRSWLIAGMAVVACSPLAAQEAVIRSSAQGFTFGNPSGAGLQSYTLTATALGVSYPLTPWVVAGSTVQFATATMSSRGTAEVGLSGLTDADVFAAIRTGPLRLRALLALGIGEEPRTYDAHVVAGLAAYEFLPFPVRSWTRGGGYGLEARLVAASQGSNIELLGAIRNHNVFSPFEEAGAEYRLGSEKRVGLLVGHSPTATSRVEAKGEVVLPGHDELGDRPIFESGLRLAFQGVAAFPIERTSILLRGDFYRRNPGDVLERPSPAEEGEEAEQPQEPDEAPLSLAGASDPRGRHLAGISLDTRTRFGRLPLITKTRARLIRQSDGEARSWLLSAGLGTEVEVRGPWPGRTWIAPTGTVHRGRVVVAEGYESTAAAWELTIDVRWEARR